MVRQRNLCDATTACFTAIFLLSQAVWASNLTNNAIIKQIKAQKVFKQDIPITSVIQSSTVTLETPYYSNRLPRDLKIDAVLMAKAVMDLDPKRVSLVNVRFIEKEVYKEIRVTAGDIKSYRLGAISTDQLLSSIKIDEKEASATQAVGKFENAESQQLQPVREADELPGRFATPRSDAKVYQVGKLGALFVLAKYFNLMQTEGVSTEHLAPTFDSASKLVEQCQLVKAQDLMEGKLWPVWNDYKNTANKAQSAVRNPKFWQSRIVETRNRLRAGLGSDFPAYGRQFLARILIAAHIQELAKSGKDVSSYRKKLKELDDLVGRKDHSNATIAEKIKDLQTEMELTVPEEQTEP